MLRLRREPLVELVRHDPDLSLELIKVLSRHLRVAYERIADMAHSRPREINKLYDALES